jgi:hypothetical protein
VKAGQCLIPQFETNQMLDPVAHDRQIALTTRVETRRRGWTPFARATPSLRPSSPGAFSSLIDAARIASPGLFPRELILGTLAEVNGAAERSAPPPRPHTQAANVLAAVKDKPFGWPRERGHP